MIETMTNTLRNCRTKLRMKVLKFNSKYYIISVFMPIVINKNIKRYLINLKNKKYCLIIIYFYKIIFLEHKQTMLFKENQ